ncbi:MAG: winged helix-turn-helix domain-containing protein [Candidatus Thiodiazotropha sp.]
MAYILWTCEAVEELFEQDCSIELAARTVGGCSVLWGFTPQKSSKIAYEHNLEQVEHWLKYDINQLAKTESAEIYWGDETGMCNDSQHE